MSFRLKPEEKSDKTARYSGAFGSDKLDSLSQDSSESTASVRERLQSLLPQGENFFQRCVIVQKDEFGYGLTVSGENPVYVDSIKEGGAAQQAGVREGDMIVKVNGNLVAKSNHKDVVKLIKSGTYVSLTLLSRQARTDSDSTTPHSVTPNPLTSSPSANTNSGARMSSERPAFSTSSSMEWITGPQPVNTEKNQELNRQKRNTIRHMYQQAKQDYSRIKHEYDQNPSEKLANQLQDQQKTLKNIEGQLKSLDSQRSYHNRSQSDMTVVVGSAGRESVTDMEGGEAVSSEHVVGVSGEMSAPYDEPDNALSSPVSLVSPLQAKSASLSSYDSGASPLNVRLGSSPPPALGIITMEDDEFESEDEHQFDDHGHFRSLSGLMKQPAHLSVFLSYLISQNRNPAAMFFYIVTDGYRQGNAKEMRKWAYEIHSTFLNERAPLRLPLDDDLVACVENVLNAKYEREDSLKTVFDDIRNHVQGQIAESLQEYCNTRALGLGSMFGDHELPDIDAMDRAGQLRTIDKILTPLLEQFLEDPHDRSQAIALCIGSFIKNLGVARTNQNQKYLERVSSFNEKAKSMFKFPKGSRKVQVVNNHSFEGQHYFQSTYCHLCGGILWGVGYQGYQCQVCDQNFHKACLENLKENCPGQNQYKAKKDKSKRSSVLDKIITRKPSNNNPGAIKEAQLLHESGLTSPSGTGSFLLQDTVPEDVETDDKAGPSRVGKLVDRYQKLNKDERRDQRDDDSPSSSEKEKRGSPVGRSESMKGRQKERNGSGNVRRTKSDVTNDDGSVMKAIKDQAVSSSSSSLSAKSTSPSISLERGLNRVIHESDSDFEVEGELPSLDAVLSRDVLKKLKPKEKKRQDVINELFYTERSHLRNLKVLEQVFYQPWRNDSNLPQKLVLQLLPNISELVRRHSVVNRAMKIAKPKDSRAFGDIADIMLDFFSGEKGSQFKEACALFCRNHRHALDQLKVKVKKDQKLAQFLQEAEANPLCRRLKLADLIPMQMQRLTKYRLLVEALIKYTPSNSGEHRRLQKVLAEFKDILAFVNQAVKECENAQKLEALQRRMEKRPEIANDPQAKNLILTEHKLLYDGVLMLKDGKSKIIECHVVLLEDCLVILQKQDEKMVLKHLNSKAMGSLKGDENFKFSSPVIPLVGLLTRNVATDKKAFFLVSVSGESRIYELLAHSVDEREKWHRHISEASEAACKKAPGGILRIPQPQPPKATSVDVKPKDETEIEAESDRVSPPDQPIESETDDSTSPTDVLRRTDKAIEHALMEKQRVIAEMFGMPVDEFEHIAEIASAMGGEKDPRELIVAAILQMNRLTTLVKDTIKPPAPTAEAEDVAPPTPPATIQLPVSVLLDIVNHLNQHLTQLLRITREREFEMENMKGDLKTASEQLKLLQDMSLVSQSPGNSRPTSFISELSESEDEVGDEACSTPQPASADREELYSLATGMDDGQLTPLVPGKPQPNFLAEQDGYDPRSTLAAADNISDSGTLRLDNVNIGESGTDELDRTDETEGDSVEFIEAPEITPRADGTGSESLIYVILPDHDSEIIATERTENNVEVIAPDPVEKDGLFAEASAAEGIWHIPLHTEECDDPEVDPGGDSYSVAIETVPEDDDVLDSDNGAMETVPKDDDVLDSDEKVILAMEDRFDRVTDEFELD